MNHFDHWLFNNMQQTIALAILDACANFFKRKALRPGYQPQGIAHPQTYTGGETQEQKTGMVVQSDFLDPRWTKFHWREMTTVRYHNVTNTPVYLVINRKWMRRSHADSANLKMYTLIDTFPTDYNITPIPANATVLTWTLPTSWAVANATNDADPDSQYFRVPRRYGAWIERFPYEPRPAVRQEKAHNLFHAGAHTANVHNVAGVPVVTDNTQGAAASDITAFVMDTSTAYPAVNDYRPTIAQTYFRNNTDSKTGGLAYTGMNFNAAPAGSTLEHWTTQTSSADSVVTAYNPTGDYTATDSFAKAREYKEIRNPVLRRIFKMRERRYTVQPGTVLRVRFKGKRHCLRGTTLMQIESLSTPWSPGNNDYAVVQKWTTSSNALVPAWGGKGSGYQAQFFSDSIRGPHLPEKNTTNLGTTAQAELWVVRTHTIWHKITYKPKGLPPHRTVQNVLAHGLNQSDLLTMNRGGPVATSTTAGPFPPDNPLP